MPGPSYSAAASSDSDDPDSPSAAGAGEPLQPPLAKKFSKVLSNVCFSLFVFAVLVVTVIAVTYEPPDPWLHSSAAITASFSAVLPNSTFHTDDSLLSTGEDVNISGNATAEPPSAVTADVANVSDIGSKECQVHLNASFPVNCSDPRVIVAVKRFNANAYARRSIIFLNYETPVNGSKDGECDVAWRFRNRREKSWRKYRDYRRFVFVDHGCGLNVTSVGKFRSGTNAARPAGRSGSRWSSRVVRSPMPDAEINDTIPVVGSESEFKKGKYLYYTRGGDHCKSMNQFVWSFLCGLGEAMYLNRTFVIDLSMCLSGAYTESGKDDEGKDFRFYFDFEHLKETSAVVEEGEFLRDWRRWDRAGAGGRRGTGRKISVRKVPTYKVTPLQLKKDKSTIIWRLFDGPEPENYWYRVCEGRAAKYVQRPWYTIWKSKHLMNIVTQIAGRMEWDYDAVHVVRGWKAQNKQLWPNLDADTSPATLVEKITKIIQPMRNLYIATNEPYYNYFDRLREHYKLHLLDDFKDLWGNTSDWYNEMTTLNGGQPVPFDGYMRVAVDTEVLYRAKTQVETFNNLTKDCKDGINTCASL